MKAVRFHEFGGPDVLRYEDAERPTAGPGQVLVEVAGTTFNPVDAAFRLGFMQQDMPVELPHIPGLDLAGTIVGTGEQVVAFLPMTLDGASAEFVAVDRELLAPAPASIPLADAAALPSGALTAWQGLFEHAGLQPGQRLLINGGGGAVGGFAIQLAKQAGAYVIATASPRSTEAVRAAGADEIIDYTAGPVGTEPVGTEPVDAVLNLARVDDAAMAALVALVKPGGVLVSTTSPAQEDQERQVRTISMYLRNDAKQLTDITAQVDAGTLKLDIGARFPLAELAKVHEESAAGALRGKTVITVR
jgi:NADPH:quinone reductase-like Zn-dependent oxidoreductase